MLVYVVTMYRFADREKHSYVLGVFDDEMLALKEAEKEQIYRGCNKYFPEIVVCVVNGKPINRLLKLGSEIYALTEDEIEEWIKKIHKENEVWVNLN